MQVLKLAALALAAAAVADAATTTTAPTSTTATSTSTTSTSTTSSTTSTTSTTAAGSSSGSTTATTGSVSCVFRYSMPTATNVPSEVAAAGSSSKKTTGSSSGDSSSSGSLSAVGSTDGSSATAGTVTTPGDGSDGSDGSDAGESASASGSDSTTKTPTSTTKTPTSTTKTPSTTTATPTSTTATPTSTTKTPTATTKTPTTTTATPTTDSSATDDTRRRLMGAVAEAGAATTTNSTASTTTAPSSSNSTSTTTSTTTTTTAPSTAAASSSGSSEGSWSSSASASSWSSSSTSSSATSTTTTVEFSCDATFYGAWAKMGLTCGDSALDVDAAAAQTQCLIYSGTADGTGVTDLKTCLSVCRFPGCANGTWDYAADDGINSDIYADLDLLSLLTYAGESAAVSGAVSQPFSNLTMTAETECDYTSDSSFSACQCDNYVYSSTSSSSTAGTSGTASNSYTVPEDKGLEDSDHWADGTTKTTVDKAGIATSTIGSSAATVSVVAGGVMSVASGVVGGTSAGVASGVSAAASVGITMAAVDLCQFSIMINQMNVDARPRFLEKMGKKMAPAGFQFLPFGKVSSSDNSTDGSGSSSSSASTSGSGTRRRLGSSSTSASGSSSSGSGSSSSTSVQGMEKYAALIGVQADKLFYLTVAGIGCLIGALFACYGLFMLAAYSFVSDFPAFSKKWFDKAIGVLMMILILSEYVIGATAMYQICYCIDNDSIDVSFGLAIIALLVMAFGTILFGVLVIRNNEEELRDLGTKDHFDKKFHARFGPLYDEYSFEGRFFFAPKLMLALLCGMTTGMVWIQGLWQIIVLIGFHIAFLFYLEMKQPYPTAFVQKTSSFVIIIKISALFLSFFLLSSATSFNEDIPDDLREGVGFAIVGLQVLVLVALMIRQMYIFYRTWKLKRDGASADDDKAGTTVVTANNRDGNTDPFFSLGEPQYGHANQQQQQQQQQQQYGQANQQQQQQYGQPGRENSVAILGDDARGQYASGGDQFEQQQQAQYQYQPGKLRGLQPPTGRRTASVVVHDGPGGYRSNEVSL